jgi:gluconokinase
VLAVDAGTSSVRALAYDLAGNAVGESEEQLRYSLETTPDGGATYPAASLFDLTVRAIDGAVARLGARADDVAAVGFTSFWHALLGLDASAAPTTPVFYWADRRSSAEATALRQELDGEAVLQRTGCRLHPSYWPAKLRWLRQTEPKTVRRTRRWLSFAEYALGRICSPEAGAVTVCMASGTGLLDVHALEWDAEMLAVAGIGAEQLSPLVDLGPPGRPQREFERRWPALAGVPWFPALGDGACANVGSGAIGPSRIALTIGTSAAMRIVLPRPPRAAWTVPGGLWAYRLDRERAVLGGALSNGGNLLRWVWETTGTGQDDEATSEAFALPPDSTGLTFLPFLAGERSPGWHDDAAGVIAGLTLSTRPAAVIRAALEAAPYRLAAVYDALAPLAAADHQILVSGGAILSMPPWLQITADVLGHPLTALSPDDESTARGAALMAAASAGLIPAPQCVPDVATGATIYLPDVENHEKYRAGRERQAQLEAILAQAGAFV